MEHVGIDVHQKYSEVCVVSDSGQVVLRDRISTTESRFRRFFRARKASRVILECGPLTPWVYRLLLELVEEVVVVNPRRVRLIAESTMKTDVLDAEVLARVGRLDLDLLRPVYQRSRAAQELRTQLRARNALVRSRAALIHSVRGTLRAQGYRIGSSTTRRFLERYLAVQLPESLAHAVDPLVETIVELSERIDRLHEELVARSRADELTARLQTVPGVGPLVSLAFVGWVDRPERFRASRSVGACLGLRPRLRSSGGHEYRGRITREGDSEMRRLLVQAAHACLRSSKDSALKRWGEQLSERVGKNKAVVALARKIGVLLHHLWISGERFRPFPEPA